MATGALRRRPCEDIVDVALGARDLRMRAGESELRSGVVVKRRTEPINRRMAQGAVLREAGGIVIGVRRLIDVRQVTPDAGGRRVAELAANVASVAGNAHVGAG
jgi:hypothetical protein